MAKMTGAEYLARALKGYGVTHIFFVPTVLSRSLAVMDLEGTGISRIITHGEKAAVYMADGFARASGRPGITMSQIVGGLNLAAGLRDAYLAGSPVIAFTGGYDPLVRYRYDYQEAEDFDAFKVVTKFNAYVEDVRRFPDLIRQAFRSATTGTPGPVHLRFRGKLGQVDEEEADLELLTEEQFGHYPPFRPEPEMEHVRKAAGILGAAKKPMIVAGGGVRISGAKRDLVELAEKLQIPVATSLNGKEIIPGSHPLSVGVVGSYSRRSANQLVCEADLIFFAGTRAGGMTTNTWRVPKIGTPAIQLDINAEDLGRNYPLQAAILGDAKVSLRKLIDAANASTAGSRKAWVEHCQKVVADWRAEFAPFLNSDKSPIRPERICKELSDHLPSDAFVLSDTGHSGLWTGGYLDLNSPNQNYVRCAGHLGWGFPAALGAKCALPDRPVVLFCGDAGFWYHIGELETAVRWKINAILVVNNNCAQNQETNIYARAYGGQQRANSRQLWTFKETNLSKVAESMGASAIRVERPGDLRGALEKALSIKNTPVVVEVVSDIEALAPGPYAGK